MKLKLKLYACLAVGALVAASSAVAAPTVPLFLSVDIDGHNAPAIGPTQAGFESFEAVDFGLDPAPDAVNWPGFAATTGLTNTYATSEGNVTVNITGVHTGGGFSVRNRGIPTPDYGGNRAVLQDFLFAQNGNDGFGQNFIRLTLSGLTPGQRYQFTGLAREQAFTAADQEFDTPTGSAQAWTTKELLGGVDGPGAWLDANVAAGATYLGIFESMDHDMDPMTPNILVDTGYKNPIPSVGRNTVSGGNFAGNPYHYAVTFGTHADAGGEIVVYTWSDANTFNGSNIQRASLLNGFQIGLVPEPASLALFGFGLIGLAGLRRRVR